MRRLGEAFFGQPTMVVATQLPGMIMARRVDGIVRRARIVEVEAYLGPKDLASHSSKGRTLRTEVMFGPPGRAYVYFIYGVHWMFNVTVGTHGEAHAMLIRGAEPMDGWDVDLTGPAKLARAFGITGKDNRMDLSRGDIAFFADDIYRPRIRRFKRVGVDYAQRWKERLLRFIDVSSPVAKRLPRWSRG